MTTTEQNTENAIGVADGQPVQMNPAEAPSVHYDKGWAWVVCFASFCMLCLGAGLHNCAGIIFVALLDRYKQSRGDTAWVTSLAAAMDHTFTIIGTYLCQRYSIRAVAMSSGFITATALVATAYSPSLELLYLTYGVGFGLGSSLCLCSALVIVPKYFKKRLAFAFSLGQLGAPVGTLALSPLLQHLFTKTGFTNTMLIIASLQVILVLAGFSFRPVNTTITRENVGEVEVRTKKGLDVSVFRCKRYILWLACLCVLMPALLIPYVHLIRLAEDNGISESDAAFLLYFVSVTSAIGRPIVGRVSDSWPKRRLQLLQFAFFFFATANFLAPLATTFTALAAYSCAFGIFEAFLWSLIYINTLDIVGIHRLPSAVGWMLFLLSFPEVSGPPLAGWIYDISKSYALAFYVSGGVVALAGLMMFSLIPYREWFCCNSPPGRRINPIPNPPASA